MESKKTLRRRLETANSRIEDLKEHHTRNIKAVSLARALGYEPIETEDDIYGGTDIHWRLTGAQTAKNAARDAELAERLATDRASAREEGRREALALVIEALEIPGYRPDAFRALMKNPGPLDHLDRFHADLTTAVEVRRDIAAASERGKVEKKVADLLKKGPSLIGVDLATGRGMLQDGGRIFPSSMFAAATVATAAAKAVDHDVATAGEKLEDAA